MAMKIKKPGKTDQAGAFMASRRQILNANSPFVVREAYKTLRTNIRFALREKGCKRFCITSAMSGEGKSITVLNLAISIAETGKKVLLIDADMRRPALVRLLVEKGTPGLSNVLAGIAEEEEAIRKELYPNLDVMFSGDTPPNPSELLSSERMQKMVERLSLVYDYILIDTPPAGVVADACIVANLLDGVLLLVRQGRSRRDALAHAVNQLNLTNAKLLGVVLNGVPREHGKHYGYYD